MNTILQGDVREKLKELDEKSIQCVVTSPPYWGLRDYGQDGQLGLEPTPEEYVANMVDVFREVKRVLRDDGTVWLNLGDSYAMSSMRGKKSEFKGLVDQSKQGIVGINKKIPVGVKQKDLVGIPWMVAFALRADGWYLRQDIIWHKPNPMPESVKDRCTKAHEYIFLLTKKKKYYCDMEAVKEPNVNPDRTNYKPGKRAYAEGNTEQCNDNRTRRNDGFEKYANGAMCEGRNKRSVWTVATKPYPGAHFAVYPPKLIEPCILAGTSPKACEKCGAPWERVIEKGELSEPRSTRDDTIGVVPGRDKASRVNSKKMEVIPKTFKGWQPTCKCENTGSGKCVVLDPFAGSGTTLQVAIENGREGVGIELNPEYVELINKRLDNIQMNLFTV